MAIGSLHESLASSCLLLLASYYLLMLGMGIISENLDPCADGTVYSQTQFISVIFSCTPITANSYPFKLKGVKNTGGV